MLDDSPDARLDVTSLPNGRQPDSGPTSADLECPSFGLARDGRSEHVYNEGAFRYFLELERKRSERSTRPFLLLLIDLRGESGTDVHVDSMTAQKLFAAMALCLRETDFIGWYHEHRVAGAVLTQHGDAPVADLPGVVYQRLAAALNEGLPTRLAQRLQVRIFQLPANPRDPS